MNSGSVGSKVKRGLTALSSNRDGFAVKGAGTSYILGELKRSLTELEKTRKQLAEFRSYCDDQQLEVNDVVFASLYIQLDKAAATLRTELNEAAARLASDEAAAEVEYEGLLRWALQSLSYFKSTLEWKSAAYDQALVAQFFDLRSQSNTKVNYERYECPEVDELEDNMDRLLNLDTSQQAVSMTSSGMGAYNLIEAYLLRDRLVPGDKVLVVPYIYFEVTEQLKELNSIERIVAPDFKVETLLDYAERHEPAVLFVDPLANNLEQAAVDMEALIAGLRARAKRHTTLVIDGTMVSGTFPAELLLSDEKLEIFYYEGANKYLQQGLDIAMAGLLVTPRYLKDRFYRLRRNTGTNLTRQGAQLFPQVSRIDHLKRMARIDHNAEKIAESLEADDVTRQVVDVVYAGSKQHPDYGVVSGRLFRGGCVTFRVLNKRFNTREHLNLFIKKVLDLAKEEGVYLTKGVSFGFLAPRISAAAAMAESIEPFLRIYAGAQNDNQTEGLVEVLKKAFSWFARYQEGDC